MLTPGELIDLLGINLQRLRVWMEKGLLGEEHRRTGRGHPRSFSRQDAIVACVILQIMDLTHRSRPIEKEGLLGGVARAIRWGLRAEGAVLSSSTGKVDPTHFLIISWDRDKKDWHMTHAIGGGSNFPGIHVGGERPPGRAFIMVPLWEIIEEVGRFFKNREAKS